MLLSKFSRLPFYFEEDGAPPGGDPPKNKKDDKPATWEAYVESLSDDVKTLYGDHISGLKSALKSERDTNKDNAAKLKRLEELEAAEEKRKQEQMSEKEKLEAQIKERDQKFAEFQAQVEQERAEFLSERMAAAVKLAATAQGFADPEDAYNLADISGVEIDEENGGFKGIEAALKKLAEAKPYLLDKSGKGDGLGNNTRKRGKQGTPPPPEVKVPSIRL